MADEYVFIDEWDVDAPQEAVFDALADARTYPEWWRPVYIAVEADCPPEVGCVSRQEFKGRLPYHLKTTLRDRPPRAPARVRGQRGRRPDRQGDLDADSGRTAASTSTSTGA